MGDMKGDIEMPDIEMHDIEKSVADHYANPDLLARILDGLRASGGDPDDILSDDLSGVDEFHIGGRKATELVVAKLALTPDQHVLDVGCGIGGAMRYISSRIGCRISGIDLTREYIATGKALSERAGMGELMSFQTASALDMPFDDATFDAAITIHVAMNIFDRAGLYGEIARVMKPGAKLCIYDVMRAGTGNVIYPVPWADTPATSHLTTPDEMHELLDGAGFDVVETQDHSQLAIAFFNERLTAPPKGPQPLGIHLILGDSAREKFINTLANVKAREIAPVEMVATRR